MGRRSNWRTGETTAIRIPKALEAQVMAYAKALDEGQLGEISYEMGLNLAEELETLVNRHRHLHEGHPDKKRMLRYSPDKHLNRLGAAYNHIQFHLTGHQTNPTNSGIFAIVRDVEEQDLILWMLLAEVLEGLSRTRGGSVHWGSEECHAALEQSA